MKGVRAFLGHAEFYRRFIKGFSTIAKPLTELLQKEVEFSFDERCIKAFDQLKEALISSCIVQVPDWSLPFELMCDASDVSIGAIVGQRKEGKPCVIYYISKTLDPSQRNYTTTKKEMIKFINMILQAN